MEHARVRKSGVRGSCMLRKSGVRWSKSGIRWSMLE